MAAPQAGQAKGYLPSAIPVVALSETGGPALALLPLVDLARLLDRVSRDGEQLSLLLGGPAR